MLWLTYLVFPLSGHARKTYSFEHIGKEKGLSQGTVNTIFQDSRGLMWFGTNDGLNSYDGVKMTVYRYQHNNPNGLQSNHILSIAEDQDGRIWIGTFGGNIQYFDPISQFFHTPALENNSTGFSGIKNAYSIAPQSNGIIWVGTSDGLFRIDPEHKSAEAIIPSHKHPGIEAGSIYALLIDNGKLWIGMEKGGLSVLDLKTQKLLVYTKMQAEREFIVETYRGTIMSIAKGPDGKLYVGTFGDYIYLIDQETQTLKQLNKEISMEYLTGHGFIRSMTAIDDSNLWAGTNGGGIQVLNVYTLKNKMIKPVPHDPFSLSYNNIKSIFLDKQGGIWVGTFGLGIDYHFPYSKKIGKMATTAVALNGLSFRSVRSIYRDPTDDRLWVSGYDGLNVFDKDLKRQAIYLGNSSVYVIHPDPVNEHILWVGIEGTGLVKMDKRTGKVLRDYRGYWDDNQHIKGTVIHSLADGPGETLWAGTERALNQLDKKTNAVTHYLYNPEDDQSLPEFRVRALFNDSKGRLWVGTLGGGLAYMMPGKNAFKRFNANSKQEGTLHSNTIFCIFESSPGQIYIGTDMGIHIYDEQTAAFKVLTTVDGLPNDVIYGILEDASGHLWISTNEGISKYDPVNNQFTNYDTRDGLQANEFNSGAFFRDHEGIMYFGGINGLNYFKPSEIKENPIIPDIIFTSLSINNKHAELEEPIWKTQTINLLHTENNFSLEFAALNFYKPTNNQYAYKFGNQDDWIELGNKNHIDFINVKPGNYELNIIASNNDDKWNMEGASIQIVISPPFHETLWFYLLLGLIGFLMMLLYFYLRIGSIHKQKNKLKNEVELRTKELQLEIAEREKIQQKLAESNSTKDKFFSIIAHDLRSPFNALLGFMELLTSDYESFTETEKKQAIKSMRNSTEKLYNLLENLLTWSRSQRGIIEMKPERFNLNEAVNETLLLLLETANQKSIKFDDFSDVGEVYAYADRNMMLTVVRNIISNAIKYSNPNDIITISIQDGSHFIDLEIRDYGIGMSAQDKAKLFRIEEQFTRKGTANESGTGLGLIICKEFIEKNNGQMFVQSELGKGTSFLLKIPKQL